MNIAIAGAALLALAGTAGIGCDRTRGARPSRPSSAQSATASVARPGFSPDGSLLPCKLSANVRPWNAAGAPGQRAVFAGWVADRYVHVENEIEAGLVHAHIYDLDAQSWQKTTFDVLPAQLRARLERAGADMRFPAFSPGDFAVTETRVVLAPQYVFPLMYGGAVLDPRTAQWTAVERDDARWVESDTWAVRSRTKLLFWPAAATPHSKAGSKLWLFDPETVDWRELPLPPVTTNREGGLVRFDGDHIVYWGGYARDQYNNPSRMYDDGAVFDIAAGTWRALAGQYTASASPTAYLRDGWLLLFGGSDFTRSRDQETLPWHLRDDAVQDLGLFSLANARRSKPKLSWDSWQRWSPGLEPCTGCGPEVEVGGRFFFNRALVYDAAAHTLERAPLPPAPASWRLPAGAHPQPLLGAAIDERHAILISQQSAAAVADAVVFDTQSLWWCALNLPGELADTLLGGRLTVHDRALYLWRDGHQVEEELPSDCPPGAPCQAPDRVTRYVPPEAVIVELADGGVAY